MTGSHTLANVDIRGGTVTIAAGTTLNVGTYLNFVSGAIATGTLAAQGTVDIQLTAISTTSTATLLLNGAGNQTVTGYHTTLVGDLPPLAINKPSGNLTLAGTLRTGHNWTFTAVGGTFTTAGSTVVFTGGTISGSHTLTTVEIRGTVGIAVGTTLTASGYLNLFSGAVNLGTLEAQANVDVQSGFTGASTGTLLIDGAGNQTVTGFHIPTSGDLPALVINKPSGNLTLAGTLRTTHNWTYTAVPGTFTTTGSMVVFAGGTITGSHTLEGVWIRGGTVTIAAATTLTATGYVNLFSGVVNTGTLEARADVDVQAGFTGGTATLLINGAGNQTVGGNHTLTVGDLPNVTINKPSGNLTLAPAGPSYTGILRTSHNWTFVSVPGTSTTTGSTIVFVGGTITGSHTLDSVWIRGGTITIAAGTTVTATGYVSLFSGAVNGGMLEARADVDVQAGFTTGGTATLLINGTGNQTIGGNHTLTAGELPNVVINKPSGNLTLAPAGPSYTGILRTSHNWTYVSVPGTFTTTGSTMVFIGRHDQRLPHPRQRPDPRWDDHDRGRHHGYGHGLHQPLQRSAEWWDARRAGGRGRPGWLHRGHRHSSTQRRGQPDDDQLPDPHRWRPARPGHQQAGRQPDPGSRRPGNGHLPDEPQLDVRIGPGHVHHDRHDPRLHRWHDHRLPHPP